MGLPKDIHGALEQFTWAASRGHANAALCAANIIYSGFESVASASDISRACVLYTQAAEGGVGEAMNSYALLLEDGRGCDVGDGQGEPDLLNAAAWYFEAATCGLNDASLNLALLLASGNVPAFRRVNGEEISAYQAAQWLKENVSLGGFLTDQFEGLLRRIMLQFGVGKPKFGANLGGTRSGRDRGKEREEEGGSQLPVDAVALSNTANRATHASASSETDQLAVLNMLNNLNFPAPRSHQGQAEEENEQEQEQQRGEAFVKAFRVTSNVSKAPPMISPNTTTLPAKPSRDGVNLSGHAPSALTS